MSEVEKQDLLDLQVGIGRALSETEDQFILYPIGADGTEHQALVNKAIYYRDLLTIIHTKLNSTKL